MILNALETLAAAALVILLGAQIKKWIPSFEKYNLPTPVVGGFVAALFLLLLKSTLNFSVDFDLTFQEPLMIAFFASIGYNASYALLKAGGKSVFKFFIITVGALVLQIALGMASAYAFGYNPLVGVLTSAAALTGGPGTALAFAPLFEQHGILGASTLGLTSAMGGIIIGGMLGSPVATHLIKKYRLNPQADDVPTVLPHQNDQNSSLASLDFLKHGVVVTLMLGFGTALSIWINNVGITLPIYIGSMIAAAVFRNIDDVTNIFNINVDLVEEIGSVALTFFIAMAIMSLDLYQLKNAALAIVIFLILQSALTVLLTILFVFRLTGKDYDAAVISGGFIGFMMGTTANAMANMNSISKKYGPSSRAYLVVPLVGTCFIDFVNAALIVACINFFS
jgi:glutamate:Na+ symporter, ESS family